MLSQFPQEIVVMIARCLNFYAKLNLAKTCRKLYTLLHDTVLFEELTIPRSRMNQVLLLFKNKRFDGSKVKLCYFDHLPKDQFLTELLIIFPNITIQDAHESHPSNTVTFSSAADEGSPISCGPHNIMYHSIPLAFIPEYQFKNLKRFSLSYFNPPFMLTASYLHRLRNLTSLKLLILHESSISFCALEAIHANCTGLENLEMLSARFTPDNFRSDHLIEPADYMKSLKIVVDGDTLFLNCSFLEYVIQKYPNLKTLDFYLKEGFHHEIITQFVNIGSSSILPTVMAKLVDRIQSLHIESCLFEYIMDRTDLAPVSIRDLGFYLWCSCHSKMFESMKISPFIQSLISLTSLTLPLSGAMTLYNTRIILPNVKHLLIGPETAKRNECLTLKLDELLFTYQNLESLEINHPYSIISLGCIDISKHLSFYSAKFNVKGIEPQVIKFIKDFLPNVNRFEYISHITLGELLFDFPEHTFYSFDVFVAVGLSNLSRKIYYHILTQGGTRVIEYMCYYDNSIKRVKELDTNEWSQKHLQKSNVFKIICKSLLELRCKGIIIF